jgi:hypothetical protein
MAALSGLSGDGAAPDLWAALCVRFHDLRQRAYAHGMRERWRALVIADQRETDLLARWLDLASEIDGLDGDESNWIVRYGEDDNEDGDADWWSGWDRSPERFVCPTGRCNRVASQGLMPPECWLSRTTMVQDGTS